MLLFYIHVPIYFLCFLCLILHITMDANDRRGKIAWYKEQSRSKGVLSCVSTVAVSSLDEGTEFGVHPSGLLRQGRRNL